jgi:cytoskeleton-associated protein 5
LRRVAGPIVSEKQELPMPTIQRLTGVARAESPTLSRLGALPRATSPSVAGPSRLARPASPAQTLRAGSPAPQNVPRSTSPVRAVEPTDAGTATNSLLPKRPKSLLPSKLGRPKLNTLKAPSSSIHQHSEGPVHSPPTADSFEPPEQTPSTPTTDDISLTISSILSSDPSRSVDALKKIQKTLAIGPDSGPSSPQYLELAEHTEGLIETICLQMAHVFEHVDELIHDENFRLAKHLIQTLNNFCDHAILAESLTVDILTSLLEELTLRLLKTDESPQKKIKDLSRFINMIILRLFATGRRMSVFRSVLASSDIKTTHCFQSSFRTVAPDCQTVP